MSLDQLKKEKKKENQRKTSFTLTIMRWGGGRPREGERARVYYSPRAESELLWNKINIKFFEPVEDE